MSTKIFIFMVNFPVSSWISLEFGEMFVCVFAKIPRICTRKRNQNRLSILSGLTEYGKQGLITSRWQVIPSTLGKSHVKKKISWNEVKRSSTSIYCSVFCMCQIKWIEHRAGTVTDPLMGSCRLSFWACFLSTFMLSTLFKCDHLLKGVFIQGRWSLTVIISPKASSAKLTRIPRKYLHDDSNTNPADKTISLTLPIGHGMDFCFSEC